MSEAKKSSLTVLGGPLGGSRSFLPEDGEITIGSAEDCTFRLDAPGVSPLHARVVLEGGRATVFSTGAERPLHINDNPLGAESATLRNGDILWLGVPGEDDVVMLQCILGPRPAATPEPAASVAEPTPDIETQALQIDSPGGAPVPRPGPPSAAAENHDEPLVMDFDSAAEPEVAVPAGDEEEIVAADEIAPVDLEGDEAVVVDEEELFTDVTPTLVEPSSDRPPPGADAGAGEARPPAPPASPEPPVEPAPARTPQVPAQPASAPPSARTRPPAPAAAPPPPPSSRAAASGGPGAPGPPARRQRPGPPRRPPSPRPSAEARKDDTEAPPSRSPALLALVGFIGVLAVAAGGWAVWRFVLAQPAPSASPVPVAAATALPPPVAATPPPVAMPTPETTPAASAPPEVPSEPAALATPPAVAPQPTPAPVPTPPPTPTPTPPPAAAAPPPAPAQPSAEELRAQQNAARVEELLGQADAALSARRYGEAVGRYDEVLTLDPANATAQANRARAVALRDLANRRFVTGRTRVQTEKAQGGGLAGFDTGDADVRKAPDFQGRIEFEMNPASGLAAGDAWTLRIFVVNEGKKAIRILGVDAVTEVNGAGGGGAVTPRTREVPTQQRMLVGELSGTWGEGTRSWSTQVTITANKGDSLRASLNWR